MSYFVECFDLCHRCLIREKNVGRGSVLSKYIVSVVYQTEVTRRENFTVPVPSTELKKKAYKDTYQNTVWCNVFHWLQRDYLTSKKKHKEYQMENRKINNITWNDSVVIADDENYH